MPLTFLQYGLAVFGISSGLFQKSLKVSLFGLY